MQRSLRFFVALLACMLATPSLGLGDWINYRYIDMRNVSDAGGQVTGPATVVAYCIDPIERAHATLVLLDKGNAEQSGSAATSGLSGLSSFVQAFLKGALSGSLRSVGPLAAALTPYERMKHDADRLATAREKIRRAFEPNAVNDPVKISVAIANEAMTNLQFLALPTPTTAAASTPATFQPAANGCSAVEPASVKSSTADALVTAPDFALLAASLPSPSPASGSGSKSASSETVPDLDTLRRAYDDLLALGQEMYVATLPQAYQRQRLIDCRGYGAAESHAVAVSLKNPPVASVTPSPSPSGSARQSADAASGSNSTNHGASDGNQAARDGNGDQPTASPSAEAEELVTVNCYTSLTASSGGSYTNVPVQAFATVPTPSPSSAARASTFRRDARLSTLPPLFARRIVLTTTPTKKVAKTQNQGSQTAYTPAAAHYRLFRLFGPDGPSVNLSVAAPTGSAQGFYGLSLGVARALYLTAGIQQSSFQDLAGGLFVGKLVPASTPITTKKVLTTKFAFGLSFASSLSNGGPAKKSPSNANSSTSNPSGSK